MDEELMVSPIVDDEIVTSTLDEGDRCSCGDTSLLFFFLILAMFFKEGILCTSQDSLLFFFLILSIIWNSWYYLKKSP